MKGLLLVLVDPAPTLEEELNDWYDLEHLPERAALPGFETAQRFTSLGDGPRYAAIYDLTELGVLQSEGYCAVSGPNFSPWTIRVTSRAHPVRLVARQTGLPGAVTGPCSRLLLLKFRNSTADDQVAIATGLEVDFRCLPTAPLELQGRVLIEGLRVFSANDVERVDLETSLIAQYHDYAAEFRIMHEIRLKAHGQR